MSNLILFCSLKLHAQFQNPRTTPSGRKVTGSERKDKTGKMASIVSTTFQLQRPRAAHAVARTNLCWRRWGSPLPCLTILCPLSTPAEIFLHTCLWGKNIPPSPRIFSSQILLFSCVRTACKISES